MAKLNDTPGIWIEIDKDMYACSICSHCVSIVPEDNRIEQFKYCPFCGKPMKSELAKATENHLCGTCEWQYSSVMCPRAKDIMSGATDTCFNEAIACEKWNAKKEG